MKKGKCEGRKEDKKEKKGKHKVRKMLGKGNKAGYTAIQSRTVGQQQ